MLVTVWTSEGAKHVTLPNNATIEDLKDVLVEHLNYDPSQLEISHGGRFVRDEVNVARFPPNTLVAEGPRYADFSQRQWHQQQQMAAQRQRQMQRQHQQQQQRFVDPRSLLGEMFGRPPIPTNDDDDDDDSDALNYTQEGIFGAPRPHGNHQRRRSQQPTRGRSHSNQQQQQRDDLEEQMRQQQIQKLKQQEEQRRREEEAQQARLLQKQREERHRALRDKEEALKALEAKRAAIRRQEEEMRRQKEEIARRELELQRQLEEEARLIREAEEEREDDEEDDEMSREATLVLHPHLQRVDLDETIHQSRSKQPSPATSGTTTPVLKAQNEEDSQTTPSTPPPIVSQTITVNITIPELDDKSLAINVGYDCLVSDVVEAIKKLEPEVTQSGVRLMFCDKYVRSEKESIRSVPLMDGSTVVACTGRYLSENEMTLYMADSKLRQVRKALAEHTERPIDRNLKLYWNELLMKALMQLDSLQEVPEDIRLRRKASVKEVMAEQDVLLELK